MRYKHPEIHNVTVTCHIKANLENELSSTSKKNINDDRMKEVDMRMKIREESMSFLPL